MIQFFRKLRQNSVLNNKTFNYLKYALGEVLLVVVGIFIAIQANEWKNKQQDLKHLNTALNDIHDELVKDSSFLVDALERTTIEFNLIDSHRKRVYDEQATLDTLVKIIRDEFSVFWVGQLPWNESAFENLKSTPSFEFMPEPIQNKLSDFYVIRDYLVRMVEKKNIQYQQIFEEMTMTYSLILPDGAKKDSYIKKITWENIESKHFVPRASILLDNKHKVWKDYLDQLEWVQRMTRELIADINKYLDK